jgi:hypothetical protein
MFRRKSYVYHVVYNFQRGNQSGRGSITIYRNAKISTVEDIEIVKNYIEKNFVNGNVIVENWIRLKNAYMPV